MTSPTTEGRRVTPEQLRAFAERRQSTADMHAKLAVKWWREACRHQKAGNQDTARDFLRMLEVAQANEQRALDDAMEARLEAARIEHSAARAAGLTDVARRPWAA